MEVTVKESLNFIAKCQKDIGIPAHTHCIIYQGYIVATNGILTYGMQSPLHLTCNPHTQTLAAAINNVAMDSSHFVLLDSSTLLLRNGRKRIKIPCIAIEQLYAVAPDAAQFMLPELFISRLSDISIVLKDNAELVLQSAILLMEGFAYAGDRYIFVQYNHGMYLPKMIIPKQFISAVIKANKKPLYFGYSENSFTVYFEDNSWIKTNLYQNNEYPDISQIAEQLSKATEMDNCPKDFAEKIDFLLKFSENGTVMLEDSVMSTPDKIKGASYEFEGLRGKGKFKLNNLQAVAKLSTHINLVGDEKAVYFMGENIKGIIARIRD